MSFSQIQNSTLSALTKTGGEDGEGGLSGADWEESKAIDAAIDKAQVREYLLANPFSSTS